METNFISLDSYGASHSAVLYHFSGRIQKGNQDGNCPGLYKVIEQILLKKARKFTAMALRTRMKLKILDPENGSWTQMNADYADKTKFFD
jgi:hypothetical protein